MPNRVAEMIARREADIKAKNLPEQRIEGLTREFDLDINEYCHFQNLKSLASANGLLTPEEAQMVYGYLGEAVETFNGQPLAVKVVLTKLFSELMGRSR